MKRSILCIVIMFMGVSVFAQQRPEAFSIRDGEIIWQAIYETEMDSTAVVQLLQGNNHLSDFENTPTGTTCKVNLGRLDYQSAGFRYTQTVALITGTQVTGLALIQFRDGRYRATVNQIVFNSDLPIIATTTTADFIGNKGIQKLFYNKNIAAILDFNLNRLFEISEPDADEW